MCACCRCEWLYLRTTPTTSSFLLTEPAVSRLAAVSGVSIESRAEAGANCEASEEFPREDDWTTSGTPVCAVTAPVSTTRCRTSLSWISYPRAPACRRSMARDTFRTGPQRRSPGSGAHPRLHMAAVGPWLSLFTSRGSDRPTRRSPWPAFLTANGSVQSVDLRGTPRNNQAPLGRLNKHP